MAWLTKFLSENGYGRAETVMEPGEYTEHGLPQPTDYKQMADLILVGKEGYGFSAEPAGEEFIVESKTTLGTHGYLSTEKKMNATFVASGANIAAGKTIGVVRNIDLAPTIAKLFQIELPAAEGRVLDEILAP